MGGLEEATLRLERGIDFLAVHGTAFSDPPNDVELVVPAGNLPVLWAMTGAPGLDKQLLTCSMHTYDII